MMGGMNKNGRLPTLILVAALAVCLLAFGTSIADTLKKGSSADDIRTMQLRLQELGYMTGKADGSFNEKTQDAIRIFKGQEGLPYDSVADDEMQALLYDEEAPSCQAFDYTLLSENVEAYYFDSETDNWVWESSANYLDDESWPRDHTPGEPYAAMGIYATGNSRGTKNRITWRFYCFDETAFKPTRLTISFPDGRSYSAAIRKPNLRTTQFIDALGCCTQVSAALGSRGREILFAVAYMTEDELEQLDIMLSDGDRAMRLDPFEANISYNPFIYDLRAFAQAWRDSGGFAAQMAGDDKTSVSFRIEATPAPVNDVDDSKTASEQSGAKSTGTEEVTDVAQDTSIDGEATHKPEAGVIDGEAEAPTEDVDPDAVQ